MRASAEKPRDREPTPAQLRVLSLVANGFDDREIAAMLHVTRNTVRTHIANVMTRLQAHSQAEAIATAMREGFLR